MCNRSFFDVQIMERLTSLSSLKVVESSTLHEVQATEIGFRERYRALVNPSTSVEASKDTFSFNILPTLSSLGDDFRFICH